MTTTLGRLLLNDVMPEGHKIDTTLDKSGLTKRLTALAREDRTAYVDVVGRLKNLGDELSTLEGVSVGLDDIAPDYATRDPIIQEAVAGMKKAKSSADREA